MDIATKLAEAKNEVVVTLGEYRFTQSELEEAFNKVAPKDNWKMPVDATAEFSSVRERIALHVAVPFFTGSVPTLEFVTDNGEFSTYKVKAAGYYEAIGA